MMLIKKTNFFFKLIQAKHAKTAIENSRSDHVKALNEKFEKRELELVTGIEALQARYCERYFFNLNAGPYGPQTAIFCL